MPVMRSRIVEAVLRAERKVPTHAAMIAGAEVVSYAQLVERARAVADELEVQEEKEGQEVRAKAETFGETVALLCGNEPAFAYGFLGALWAGKRVAVLPTLAPAPLLALMSAEAGAEAALVSAELKARAVEAGLVPVVIEDAAKRARAAEEKSPHPIPDAKFQVQDERISNHEPQRTHHEPQDTVQGPPDPGHELRGMSCESAAVLLYTSGSTGKPKAVALSEENILSNIQGCIDAMKFTPQEVMLAILPLFHSYGLTVTLLLPLTLGARAVLEKFSPRSVLAAIEKHRVTALIAVPSQYRLLAKDPTPADVRSLRYCIAGAERLPEVVAEDFEKRFDKPILEGYGCTEASPVIAINPPWANHKGSVGPALPNIRVSIREDWEEVPQGAQGEICVAGPSVMLGYHRQPEATAAKIRRGVLRTGDRGFLDAQGYLRVAGRADDMLKVAGEKIYPAEVEQAIEQAAGVEEAAVIGVPDETRGMALVAYVQPKPGVTLTEAGLRSAMRAHLEAIKVPKTIVVVEQLPRTPTGKLDKKKLASQK